MDRIVSFFLRLLRLTPLVLPLLLPACRSDKQDTEWQNQDFVLEDTSSTPQIKDSVDLILTGAMRHNTRFEDFSAAMDVRLSMRNMGISVGGQLRIVNGKTVWGSFSKFIELIRYEITPDTFLLWNKFENTGVHYTDSGEVRFMPLLFRFSQLLFLRQIDTVMFEGERSLNTGDSVDWIINGVLNDSLAWQVKIGKEDFRLKNLLVTYAQKGSRLQAGIAYPEEEGFEIRLSANGMEMFKATAKYTKIKWNSRPTIPPLFNASTQVEYNRGLIRHGQDFSTDFPYANPN